MLLCQITWAAPTTDDMVMAAQKDDPATLREGLNSGFNPNYTDREGNTLLIHAAANMSPAATAVLLQGGADPLRRNKVGDDALNYAALKGSLPIVKDLVASGVPVTRRQGWQPLTYAVFSKQLPVFNYLMDKGAAPNAVNPNQATALMFAAELGQEEMVDRLLAAGADPTWTREGESAVDWALKTQNTDIAEKIMKAQAKIGLARSEALKDADADSDPNPESVDSNTQQAEPVSTGGLSGR
jgi:ankyrin repeat protein